MVYRNEEHDVYFNIFSNFLFEILTIECPAFIYITSHFYLWLQLHRKWLGDIRDIGDTVSPVGILRLNGRGYVSLFKAVYSDYLFGNIS